MEAERPPNRKEKLTIAGQIEDLRRRGVRFDAGEVELARDCLAHRRSLLHLSAYRSSSPSISRDHTKASTSTFPLATSSCSMSWIRS